MTKPFSVYNALFMDYTSTKHILQEKEKEIAKVPRLTCFPPGFDYLKLNVDGSW